MQRFRLFSLLQASAGQRVVGNASSVPMRGGLYSPCGENFMEVYLNRADVRAALHVNHERRWSSCDDQVFDEYDQASHDAPMQPIWTELVRGTDWEALGMAPLNVLIASGDNDAVCGVHGTQRWVLDLGLNLTSFWQPWFYTDPLYATQLGGYYTRLEGLHFATVRGAGHEIPAYKPAAAFALLQATTRGVQLHKALEISTPKTSTIVKPECLSRCMSMPFPSPFSWMLSEHPVAAPARRVHAPRWRANG